jgi:hypothetical protein
MILVNNKNCSDFQDSHTELNRAKGRMCTNPLSFSRNPELNKCQQAPATVSTSLNGFTTSG